MEIRDILLFLHGDAPGLPAARLATAWAKDHGAAVTACCLCPDPAPSIADCYTIGLEGAADVLDRRKARVQAAAQPAESAFRAAAAEAGVVADWLLPDPNERAEELSLRARFFDLAIVPRAQGADHPARDLAEALALRSGAPCILTPDEPLGRPVQRIVLAWNGSVQARRAIDDALPLLKRASAVQLVVLGDSANWLDHCRAEQMIRRLARHEVDASLQITPGAEGVAEDLAASCAAFEADLLVMGAYSRSRASETVLGGATRTVLAGFPIPVLMSR